MSIDMPSSSQSQKQNQEQVVTVNLNSSSDPELERRIFSQVHSAGRQLGNLAAVVQLLIDNQKGNPNFAQTKEDKTTIDVFEAMQADIVREKQRREPEYLIEQLENLRAYAPATFSAIKDELRKWLAEEN